MLLIVVLFVVGCLCGVCVRVVRDGGCVGMYGCCGGDVGVCDDVGVCVC